MDRLMMSHNGGRQANERIERTSSGQAIQQERFSSTTVDSPVTNGSLRSTASYSYDAGDTSSHSIMINSDTTNEIQVVASSSEISQATSLNSGTSQGEDPIGPSATNRIQVVVSSPEICQATSSLNPGTSQGEEDPSPSATNERELTLDEYRPLLQAAIKGDWPAAKAFHNKYPNCVRALITKDKASALYIAVIAQRTTFIKEWLELMTPKDLELKTIYGFTALHRAAASGIVGIAEQLVESNEELLFIPDNAGDKPLNVAAYQGHANMVSHLLPPTTPLERLTKENRIELFRYIIINEQYDIALKILKMDSSIVTADTECGWIALRELAKKPFAKVSESQLSFWKSRLNSWLKGICNKAKPKTSVQYQLLEDLLKLVRSPDNQLLSNLVLFEAAKVGNVKFLILLIRSYPDLIWQQDEKNMSIFHFAILYRHENVFKLIYEIGANKDDLANSYTSDKKDNMLHLAGKLPPLHRLNIVSGAALQMQRELLWFKEIEKIVGPSNMNEENLEGQTPKEIFIKEHNDLQNAGEKWMKDTANSCMLVATLITTVIFTSAFTVPGGNDQEKGTPIFLRRIWFMVFFISNAIALCFSSTSMAIFLSILTSRYTEEDFLKSIPKKLLFGLSTLFISMAGMMVAFCATCFLMFTSTRAWAPVVVFISASIPITSFVLLHRKIWFDTFLSTYKSRFLFQPYKHRLF